MLPITHDAYQVEAAMPKANLVLPDGTTVTIEGTADEVANLIGRLSGGTLPTSGIGSRTARKRPIARARTRAVGPADHIRELIASNFFNSKRGLGDVQKKLEEGAHIYPITHLSPVLFRLVKAKELRRIKEGGAWKYVNP
jgi:hypothetical protein